MSICWFSNSYSSEILAFEQVKPLLTNEHQTLQESETFHIFCNKKPQNIRFVCLFSKQAC